MTNNPQSASDYRGSPEGSKLCEDTLDDCVNVVTKNADAANLPAVQKLSLLMETGTHMIASGAFSLACLNDPQLKSDAMAMHALDLIVDIAKQELTQAIKTERQMIALKSSIKGH